MKVPPSLAEPRFTVQVIDIDNRKVLYAQKLCRDLFAEGSDDKHMEEKLAKHLKHCFEKAYDGVWHCVVGTSFGAFVTHRQNHFLYFYVDNFAVMLYKNA